MALILAGLLLAAGCSEETSLAELEGLWRFTFQPSDRDAEGVIDLQIVVDDDHVLMTPVVDGRSRIDQRRAGSIEGTPDSFTMRVSEPEELPEGCSLVESLRTIRGSLLEGRLSGSYDKQVRVAGQGCGEELERFEQGSFGAVSIEP